MTNPVVKKDISYGMFGGAYALLYILTVIFGRASAGGRSPQGQTLVLLDYFGQSLGAIIMGFVVVGIIWLAKKARNKSYFTPRRDIAISSFAMLFFILYGMAHASPTL